VDGHSEHDVLEEIAAGGLPADVHAQIVAEPAPFVRCCAPYVRAAKIFPETCSLAAGHGQRAHTSNHFTAAIGWWA
jgi:hypothetical protein